MANEKDNWAILEILDCGEEIQVVHKYLHS